MSADGRYVRSYAQTQRASAGALARHAALDVLSSQWRFTGRAARALERPRVHFLCLHHVFEDEELRFRDLLQVLSKTQCFVSYSEAVRRIREGEIDRPYLAFSFDDGLHSCLRSAEILEEFGASACYFVCSSIVGADFDTVRAFCAERIHMPPVELLGWADVETLLSRGHEIGSHTRSHRNLAELSRAELEDEIGGSREDFVRRIGSVSHFAWPFGRFRQMSVQAVSLVQQAGYASCASGMRGAHVLGEDSSPEWRCLKRDHCVAAWPIRHSVYLLARTSERASAADGRWPHGWSTACASSTEVDARR